MEDKKAMRLDTAAAQYDIYLRTLRQMCVTGKLKGAKKVGRRWYVPVDVMDKIFGTGRERNAGCKRAAGARI